MILSLPLCFARPCLGRTPDFPEALRTYAQMAANHAADLLQQFPPQTHFIFNYGPSTAVTSAYFRSVLPDPIARRNYYSELMLLRTNRFIKDLEQRNPNEQKTDIEALWDEIFERALPSDQILHGRTLVIHRYLWSGATLHTFLKELFRYRNQKRPNLKLGFFLIGDLQSVKTLESSLPILFETKAIKLLVDEEAVAMVGDYLFDRHPIDDLLLLAETKGVLLTRLANQGIHHLSEPNPNRMEIYDVCDAFLRTVSVSSVVKEQRPSAWR